MSENFKVNQVPSLLRRGKRIMMAETSFAWAHKLKAFARLECFPEMLLFAQVDAPKSAIVDALIHFCHRYPSFVVALFKAPFLWSATYRKGVVVPLQRGFESADAALEWIRKTAQLQVKERFEPSVEWQEKFYDTFFDSQFISSRKNRSLQSRLMPSFFVQKGSAEHRSMLQARHTKPNTNLRQFE